MVSDSANLELALIQLVPQMAFALVAADGIDTIAGTAHGDAITALVSVDADAVVHDGTCRTFRTVKAAIVIHTKLGFGACMRTIVTFIYIHAVIAFGVKVVPVSTHNWITNIPPAYIKSCWARTFVCPWVKAARVIRYLIIAIVALVTDVGAVSAFINVVTLLSYACFMVIAGYVTQNASVLG